jgi:hypothetical protein
MLDRYYTKIDRTPTPVPVVPQAHSTVEFVQSAFCGICFREETSQSVELTVSEPRMITNVFICRQCVENISRLFDSSNHGKQLQDGVLVETE